MSSWFDDPSQLFRSDKVLSFWPSARQTPSERINSSTRFILYVSSILYLLNRDVRVIVLALIGITVLLLMHKGIISTNEYKSNLPTDDNHVNRLIFDDYEKPMPSPEYPTYNDVPYMMGRSRTPMPEQQRYAAERQFYTVPRDPWAPSSFYEKTGRSEVKADFWGDAWLNRR